MNLKICGITKLEDARYVVAAGATHLGFIMDPGSPRYIEPHRAKEIIDWVYGAQTVGVFVDPSLVELKDAISTAGFDIVQLHGNESVEFCRSIDVPVIKVISIDDDSDSAFIEENASQYSKVVDWLMFDTARTSKIRQAFDWSIVTQAKIDKPYFIAGGINDENVIDARSIQPFGLDVSSSLESEPGVKDFDKVDQFMTKFKQ